MRVERVHPRWRELVRTEKFSSWLKQQPETTRLLSISPDSTDAIRLLDLYRIKFGTENEPISPKKVGAEHISGQRRVIAPEDIYQRLSPSVVSVSATKAGNSSRGSGVSIVTFQNRQIVATNHHVIDGARAVKVQRGSTEFNAKIIADDPELDLTLLSVEAGSKWPNVSVNAEGSPAVGSSVFAIGSPLGYQNSFSQGIVSGEREDGDRRLLQTTAPISPGNSGGGLFDQYGQLIGITTLKARGGENLNFALPASYTRTLLDAYLAREAVVVISDGEPEGMLLKNLERRGSFLKYLASTDPTTGERRYEKVMVLAERFRTGEKPEQIYSEVLAILSDFERNIDSYKIAPPAGASSTKSLICKVPPNRDVGPMEIGRSISVNEDWVVEPGSGKKNSTSLLGNRLVWSELINGDLFRLDLDKLNGRLVASLLKASGVLPAGHILFVAECRLN